jgi:hypothetical protein
MRVCVDSQGHATTGATAVRVPNGPLRQCKARGYLAPAA